VNIASLPSTVTVVAGAVCIFGRGSGACASATSEAKSAVQNRVAVIIGMDLIRLVEDSPLNLVRNSRW
jgi:hypothetical protein